MTRMTPLLERNEQFAATYTPASLGPPTVQLMPFIETADRTSLFVTGWGSGPPMVFTHAWGLRSGQRRARSGPALPDQGLQENSLP